MLTNTWTKTVFKGVSTKEWLVKNGARQGGILSPFLFSFYINEMLESFSKCNIGCMIGLSRVNIISYADDIIVMAPSAIGLQKLLDKICSHLNVLDLFVNTNKSTFIIFKCIKNSVIDCNILLEGVSLKRSYCIKYLGVMFDENKTCGADISRCMSAFLGQFNALYYKFHKICDLHMFSFLFKTYCSSFYGMETWYDIMSISKLYKSIAVAYHKAIKRICGLNKWDGNHLACEKLNVSTFEHLLAKRIASFSSENNSLN